MKHSSPRIYMVLSVFTALVTMGLKFASYALTNSIGLFSDAAESGVNLVAALFAFWVLSVAARPADHEHAFGHSKAEYFSSGMEGVLVLGAAIGILVTAVPRLTQPQALTQIDLGLALSTLAAIINGGVAYILLKAGKRLRSITLRADAHHLLTDVWTSVGVVGGLILVKVTGWQILDPLLAIAVAANIWWVGSKLILETANGLMDSALPDDEQAIILDILKSYQNMDIEFHALLTRVAGSRNFVSFHVLVPGQWTVQQGHDLCEEIEHRIMEALEGTHVTTHMEPIEDPVSWEEDAISYEVPLKLR